MDPVDGAARLRLDVNVYRARATRCRLSALTHLSIALTETALADVTGALPYACATDDPREEYVSIRAVECVHDAWDEVGAVNERLIRLLAARLAEVVAAGVRATA